MKNQLLFSLPTNHPFFVTHPHSSNSEDGKLFLQDLVEKQKQASDQQLPPDSLQISPSATSSPISFVSADSVEQALKTRHTDALDNSPPNTSNPKVNSSRSSPPEATSEAMTQRQHGARRFNRGNMMCATTNTTSTTRSSREVQPETTSSTTTQPKVSLHSPSQSRFIRNARLLSANSTLFPRPVKCTTDSCTIAHILRASELKIAGGAPGKRRSTQ
eukprot:CAMPEP_0117436632 /NCGR_PEP_ID=MMETSP0759-20121206/1107_1 /TAXON_ID=63605 /ORGANISM="Percolomonas cosmopolitus, Strain WS" /LENGTH=216 /DNA_ID=CAMNT_0005228237 /DNA_START=203 /DNA_END=853 /DNA_ORIENTATION=+